MADEKREQVNFRLGSEYLDLLEEIAWRNKTNQTEMARRMIDRTAHEMGMTPVGEVVPLAKTPDGIAIKEI